MCVPMAMSRVSGVKRVELSNTLEYRIRLSL